MAAMNPFERPLQEVLDALEGVGIGYMIDTGFKVDLVPRRKRPFSTEEFSRRHYVEFLGKPRAFVTPEDTLLAKLEWAKRGGSARQIEDALAIVMGVGKLDRKYLKKWAQELGVRELLEEVERKAERRQGEGT